MVNGAVRVKARYGGGWWICKLDTACGAFFGKDFGEGGVKGIGSPRIRTGKSRLLLAKGVEAGVCHVVGAIGGKLKLLVRAMSWNSGAYVL